MSHGDAVETTLLMLVTDADCPIANYSIRSYRNLWAIYRGFRLRVYANSLTRANKRRYFRRWRSYPFVVLIDNETNGIVRPRNGELFTTPEGIQMRYEGNCEHQEQVWAREQRACDTDFFGTVDADFELLGGTFIPEMLARLKADTSLAACSTDYSPTVEGYFDSYSNSVMTLSERWHTWCCIYRRDVRKYLDVVSPAYFERRLADGTKHVFDSYAHFQSVLRDRFGFRFDALGQDYGYQYIHYGAFSKNRSLGPWTVALYRWAAIANGPGLVRSKGQLGDLVNGLARNCGRYLFSRYFTRIVEERSVYSD